MRAWLTGVVLLIAVGCSGGASTHTIHGTLTVPADATLNEFPNRCFPADGYDDIDRGASVKITNGSGDIVGTTELADLGHLRSSSCVFRFTATDVKDADFYTVKVSHRDGPAYKRKELEARGWKVALTLG